MTPAELAVILLAACIGAVIGHVIGERRGRDAQWCDDFIDAGRRERARRDSAGKFRRLATK